MQVWGDFLRENDVKKAATVSNKRKMNECALTQITGGSRSDRPTGRLLHSIHIPTAASLELLASQHLQLNLNDGAGAPKSLMFEIRLDFFSSPSLMYKIDP